MKLFQNSGSRAGALFILLATFLLALAFNVEAQEVKSALPRDESQSVTTPGSVALATKLGETTEQLSQPASSVRADLRASDNDDIRQMFLAERSSTSSLPATPPQGSTKSTYVFPTKHERFKRYVGDTFGPWSLVGAALAAGIDEWEDNPPEWRQGGSGYAKRYASSFGQNAIQQTVSYGLAEAFRLDTGFQKSNRHGFGARLSDALIQNVTSRTRSGKRILSAPRLAGFYVGGAVPVVTWYPSRFGLKDGLREGTYSLATGFAVNVLREFILHR